MMVIVYYPLTSFFPDILLILLQDFESCLIVFITLLDLDFPQRYYIKSLLVEKAEEDLVMVLQKQYFVLVYYESQLLFDVRFYDFHLYQIQQMG